MEPLDNAFQDKLINTKLHQNHYCKVSAFSIKSEKNDKIYFTPRREKIG